ncbi:MAG TPA: hypothetical protein DDW65_17270 [Firmicutes bacterium]|jgi:hypothetical protein|nr:hypothetical protein [Bacillota bacterium]
MSSKCSVLQDIANVSQNVDSFLSTPAALTPTTAAALINQILLLQGAVRDLPINAIRKTDILNRLNQAITLLQGVIGLTNIETILSVSQILQTVALKVENLCLPCSQGITIVHPSNTFSTICNCC